MFYDSGFFLTYSILLKVSVSVLHASLDYLNSCLLFRKINKGYVEQPHSSITNTNITISIKKQNSSIYSLRACYPLNLQFWSQFVPLLRYPRFMTSLFFEYTMKCQSATDACSFLQKPYGFFLCQLYTAMYHRTCNLKRIKKICIMFLYCF